MALEILEFDVDDWFEIETEEVKFVEWIPGH